MDDQLPLLIYNARITKEIRSILEAGGEPPGWYLDDLYNEERLVEERCPYRPPRIGAEYQVDVTPAPRRA